MNIIQTNNNLFFYVLLYMNYIEMKNLVIIIALYFLCISQKNQ